VIPDEAVEAAMDVMLDDGLVLKRSLIHDLVAAAAPHLMAAAWDEAHFAAIGCDSTCCDYMHDAPRGDMNPYRNANKEQV
jgi:hypothetical protein